MTKACAIAWCRKEAPAGLSDAEVLSRLRNARCNSHSTRVAALLVYRKREKR
jgi:hypothetical protein